MAIYPAYPNSEIYILKNIPITNEDKVNFYGKSAQYQAGYFLGAEYKTPDKFLRNKEKIDSIDISAMLKYYPNCVYVGLKYSVIKSNYIEIPINIYNLQSGNYLVFRNNIKPYVTDVEPNSDSVDISHTENIFNDIYQSGETKPPILDWASTDFIYAFITNLEYINANATRIYFAVDKFTTYCRDIQYKECLIEREHDNKNNDFYYDYINEDFQYEADEKSYDIINMNSNMNISLVVCTGSISAKYFPKNTEIAGAANEFSNKVYTNVLGVPTNYALYPVYTSNITQFFTNAASTGNGDLIKCVVALPTNILDYLNFNENITTLAYENGQARTVYYNENPAGYKSGNFVSRELVVSEEDHTLKPYKYITGVSNKDEVVKTIQFDMPTGDKKIRNNKTLSYIKCGIYGNDALTYKTHWLTSNSITFGIKVTNIIPNITYSIYIKDGDGINNLSLITNYSTSINGIQFQYNYDTYLQNLANETANINAKKEIAQNNQAKNAILTAASIFAALVATATPSITAKIASYTSVAASSANLIYGAENDEAKIESLISNTGADSAITSSSLPWNDKFILNTLGIYLNVSYPNHTYITMIDDYFSAYGYKTNRFGKPRFITGAIGNRKYYNYIKTTNCNYILNRPFEDINEIRQLFNNGVRMWTPKEYTDFANGNIGFGGNITVNTDNPNA